MINTIMTRLNPMNTRLTQKGPFAFTPLACLPLGVRGDYDGSRKYRCALQDKGT